jgi:hypothetical protein
MNYQCKSCGSNQVKTFYEVKQIPVHSVLLMRTRDEAIRYPKGEIQLGFCEDCGFIYNVLHDPDQQEYSQNYEETQGFSPTFNVFHKKLANHLINKYNLHQKKIIEIGCGKGEFLNLICEIGNNQGIGFDPAYVPSRDSATLRDQVTFIQDFYSEKYTHYHGDFVCCKMTLEHIPNVGEFMATVRRSIGNQLDTIVFFQIPNVNYILNDQAFWDIYYEHCSYFSLGAIARLFRQSNFDVIDLSMDYDDQYLMIEAKPSNQKTMPKLPQENDLQAI